MRRLNEISKYAAIFAVCGVLLASSTSALAAPPDQDHEWFQWLDEPTSNSYGHWYALTDFYTPWQDAESEAIAAGGHLAIINDSVEGLFDAENEWLLSQFDPGMSTHGAWLGFFQDHSDPSYSEPGGGWKWVDGETTSFTGWQGQEPNNLGGGEDWAVLEPDDGTPPHVEWNDIGPGSPGFPAGGIPGIIEVVPEPATLSLLLFGGLVALKRRR